MRQHQCYSQLQAEGHPQHLKALHLKVHPDGRLVVLVKGVLAKTVGGGSSRMSVSPGRGRVLPLQPPPASLPSGLPVNEAGLPHRQVPHHDDLGDLEAVGAQTLQEGGGHTVGSQDKHRFGGPPAPPCSTTPPISPPLPSTSPPPPHSCAVTQPCSAAATRRLPAGTPQFV